MIKLKTRGVTKTTNILGNLKKIPENTMKKLSVKVKEAIETHTPVKTGKMKASWDFKDISPTKITITNEAEHASYVLKGVKGYIYPRVKKKLRFNIGGALIFTNKVRGQAPKKDLIISNAMKNVPAFVRIALTKTILES